MNSVRATVVVPMYNAAAHVLDQLEALSAQTMPADQFEVVWVDNGSTDKTFDLVANAIESKSNMRLIRSDEIPTSYYARNAGAGAARGDLLLFCDADDVVGEDWVRAMAAALEDADLAGGSLEFTRANPGAPPIPQSTSLEARHGFLPAAPTSNLGIRRSVFQAIGGFRPDGLSGEDLSLCWRAQLRGYSLVFAPEAVVHFRYRKTARARFARQFKFGWHHRSCAAEFVEAGAAQDLRPAQVVRLVGRHAWGLLVRKPRRGEGSSLAWHLGVLYSFARAPHTARPIAVHGHDAGAPSA